MIRITRQVREEQNMTYELDCSGVPLTIRIFEPVGDFSSSTWRVEISAADLVIASSAGSRALAFALVVERWGGSQASGAYKALDWHAIGAAMSAARAL